MTRATRRALAPRQAPSQSRARTDAERDSSPTAAKPQVERIVLAHGGGGELTNRLVAERIVSRLGRPAGPLTDGAVLGELCANWADAKGNGAAAGRQPLVLTTDSYVVTPIEFPGGDIGRLAVAGTVNDLAVMGARPLAISLGLILEEGLTVDSLDRIIASIAATSEQAGAPVVTGDTKVIERRGDPPGMFINTAGVGVRHPRAQLGLDRVEAGDAILINGGLAEHGLAVLSRRTGIGFETTLRSDVMPLWEMTRRLLECGASVRFMRDATRGGLAGVLADICDATGLSIEIDERRLPISPAARGAAEMLGLDPLAVANEGKLVCVVAATDAPRALAALRAGPEGAHAVVIGRVQRAAPPLVELVTVGGGRRIVQRPYGEDLPRIC